MRILFLLLLLVFLAIARDNPPHRERHRHKSAILSGLVLTESGQLCHFPFLHGRMMYHTCIQKGKLRPWCSLTRNLDKDRSWSFCSEGHNIKDHCESNPCGSRGVCKNTLRGHSCDCNEPYTGKDCSKDKCFDKKLQQYFEPRETWLRYFPPILEECTCGERGIVCKPTMGKPCSENPCRHGGHCMQNRHDKVCGCTVGYIGHHCEINKNENCISGNGESYSGTANTTVTGAACMNWESDVIEDAIAKYSEHHKKKHGIGDHSYCRNPDEDTEPWCFMQKDMVLSWEHCNIPRCHITTASTSKPSRPALPPTPTKKPPAPLPPTKRPLTPTRKPPAPLPPTKRPLPPTKKPPAPLPPTKISLPPTRKPPAPLPTQASSHPVSTAPPTKPSQSRDVGHGIPADCGKRFLKSPSMTSRIVGGMVALPAAHPYMAAIYMGNQFCGGSLISSCWVVTAAHCLDQRPSLKDITVVLGQNLFNTTDQRTAVFQVQKYIIHQQYSEFTFQNDIALMKLQDVNGVCAQFSQFIQPICLQQITKATGSVQHCEVAGWGHQYHGADYYALFLQEAHMPILPLAQCQSPFSHGDKILPGMFCAGFMEGGVDACQGDSGGPLVCEVDGIVHLFGIVSWGSGCAEENKPGIYTDVSKYTDWIINNMV
ncbi:coagulation factor XII [Hyperolius riggenbachi]|uniref:coagulation factor XII n=1 Tax=Hyperolius riggenbachi TaxID=752182 RepID=UPI0035A3206C